MHFSMESHLHEIENLFVLLQLVVNNIRHKNWVSNELIMGEIATVKRLPYEASDFNTTHKIILILYSQCLLYFQYLCYFNTVTIIT